VDLYTESDLSDKWFILNKENMAMIYLYEHKKSFIFPSSDKIKRKSTIDFPICYLPECYGGTTTLILLDLYEKFIHGDNSKLELSMVRDNLNLDIRKHLEEPKGMQYLYNCAKIITMSNKKLFPMQQIHLSYGPSMKYSDSSPYIFFNSHNIKDFVPEVIPYTIEESDEPLYVVMETSEYGKRMNDDKSKQNVNIYEDAYEEIFNHFCIYDIDDIISIYDNKELLKTRKIITYLFI
jgi:hypothetical protein